MEKERHQCEAIHQVINVYPASIRMLLRFLSLIIIIIIIIIIKSCIALKSANCIHCAVQF